MRKIEFRQHRGSLKDAMETVEMISSKADIAKICTNEFVKFKPSLIEIAPYGGFDHRTGCDTHIVTYPNYGVLGFTNGNIH